MDKRRWWYVNIKRICLVDNDDVNDDDNDGDDDSDDDIDDDGNNNRTEGWHREWVLK